MLLTLRCCVWWMDALFSVCDFVVDRIDIEMPSATVAGTSVAEISATGASSNDDDSVSSLSNGSSVKRELTLHQIRSLQHEVGKLYSWLKIYESDSNGDAIEKAAMKRLGYNNVNMTDEMYQWYAERCVSFMRDLLSRRRGEAVRQTKKLFVNGMCAVMLVVCFSYKDTAHLVFNYFCSFFRIEGSCRKNRCGIYCC